MVAKQRKRQLGDGQRQQTDLSLPQQKDASNATGSAGDDAYGLKGPVAGPTIAAKVEKAYKALTGRDVRRGYNPKEENVDEIKRRLARSIQSGEPVHLVAFWGGSKESMRGLADEADEQSLDVMKGHVDKLQAQGIKAKATLFFTDVHATHLNGQTSMRVDKYYQGIKKLADERGLSVAKASETLPYGRLHREMGSWNSQRTFIGAELNGTSKPDVGVGRSFLGRAQDTYHALISDENGGERMRKQLFCQARRHSTRAGSVESTEKVVQRYIAHRLFEAEKLPEKFPDAVFMTYSHPSSHSLQPGPSLFMYSMRKGTSECPWFIDAAERKVQGR